MMFGSDDDEDVGTAAGPETPEQQLTGLLLHAVPILIGLAALLLTRG